MEMVFALADVPRWGSNSVVTRHSGLIELLTLRTWQDAVLNGRLIEAAALRRYVESFEDETTAADVEWQ